MIENRFKIIVLYVLGGLFVAGSIYGAFVYLPEKFTKSETQLATISESITQIDESSQLECPPCECPECKYPICEECPICECEDCPICEPEIITKEVIKEISADCPICPTCSDCSDEQMEINSLKDQIASLQSQIQSLISENQDLKEEVQNLQSVSTEPSIEYSDLQPIIKDVSKTISGSPPQTGGTTITLLSLSNLGGRSFQLQKIVFTTNDNPQFYNLKACNKSDSCSGWGEPVFGNNGSYYWEGSINISSAWNMTVEIAKQNCKPELNNCDWTQLNLNINLDDWILWDNSTNKQVRLAGQDNITITSD